MRARGWRLLTQIRKRLPRWDTSRLSSTDLRQAAHIPGIPRDLVATNPAHFRKAGSRDPPKVPFPYLMADITSSSVISTWSAHVCWAIFRPLYPAWFLELVGSICLSLVSSAPGRCTACYL